MRGWLLAFLAVNLAFPHDGGGNPRVRFAAMACFLETGSFRIDPTLLTERKWSWDWSRAPDGHYYANKAPGTMLLGLPLYGMVDQYTLGDVEGLKARLDRRLDREPVYNLVLSLFLQLLPFAAAVALAAAWMERRGMSRAAIHLMAAAALFGNTAAVFANTYFGHLLTAAFLLAATLALLDRRYAALGFVVGMAVLCEYAAVFAALPLLLAVLVSARRALRPWVAIAAGGAAPAAAWSAYHAICFGSPFRTALQYLNPMFVTDPTIAGVPIARGLHLEILWELLAGSSRGLLVTQPWVLLVPVLAVVAARRKALDADAAATVFVAAASLAGLLFMCSRHPHGWHSGWSSGPRYFCAVLPLFALAAGVLYDRLGTRARATMWILLAVSVLFTGLALSTTILSPTFEPLWPTLVRQLLGTGASASRVKLAVFVAAVGLTAWRAASAERTRAA